MVQVIIHQQHCIHQIQFIVSVLSVVLSFLGRLICCTCLLPLERGLGRFFNVLHFLIFCLVLHLLFIVVSYGLIASCLYTFFEFICHFVCFL